MNYAELGEKVKAKYPEYKDVDSAELGQRTAAKYPEYKAMITVDTPTAQPKTSLTAGEVGSIMRDSAVYAAQKTGERAAGMLEGATMGIPRAIIKSKTGYELPTGDTEGRVMGSLMPTSLAAKGASAVMRARGILQGSGALNAMGRTAVEGAVASQAITPEDSFFNWKQRTQNALVGAGSNVALGAGAYGLGQAYRAIPEGLKEGAARTINSMIKPLLRDFSYSKNPGRGIAAEGIKASSMDELVSKIDDAQQRVYAKLSTKVQNNTSTIDYSDLADDIDQAIARAQKAPNTNKALISRLEGTKDDLLGIVRDADGNIISQRDLSKLTAQEALELKQTIGEITKFTGNKSDDELVNMALKKTYGKVKARFNNTVSGAKELSEHYADLISAKAATQYRELINQRKNLVGLAGKIGMYGAGAMVGANAGVGGTGAGAGVLLVEAGDRLFSSPWVKTRLASGAYRLGSGLTGKMGNYDAAFEAFLRRAGSGATTSALNQ